MSNKKTQILRDSLLITGLLVIVLFVFIIYNVFKVKGELALVMYNNEVLFEVDMENGQVTTKTPSFVTTEMPVISNGELIVLNESFQELKEGVGVLIYKDDGANKDFYFVKGNLGFIKIYYNRTTKKMKVVEETSPYNTCSKQGESNDVPIVCLPNFVTIKFTKNELDDIV